MVRVVRGCSASQAAIAPSSKPRRNVYFDAAQAPPRRPRTRASPPDAAAEGGPGVPRRAASPSPSRPPALPGQTEPESEVSPCAAGRLVSRRPSQDLAAALRGPVFEGAQGSRLQGRRPSLEGGRLQSRRPSLGLAGIVRPWVPTDEGDDGVVMPVGGYLQGRRPSLGLAGIIRPMAPGDDADGPVARGSAEDASDSSDSSNEPAGQRGVFIDLDQEMLKEAVRNNLLKVTYDVVKYYHKTGLWRKLATHPWFDHVTLGVIGLNAIWIGVDADMKGPPMLLHAEVETQVIEHVFCLYFAFEWFVRFMSFRVKANGLKDGWFVFDTLLVSMMVAETWVLTLVMISFGAATGDGFRNASLLRIVRLTRMSRMARMARLLRVMPELLILVKGIMAATRSVLFTMILLCVLLYVFGIGLTVLTRDSEVGDELFSSLLTSMYTLLIYGVLLDNVRVPLGKLGRHDLMWGFVYLAFTLLAALSVLNMLIGVLCEVVRTISAVERELNSVTFTKARLDKVLRLIDTDGDGTISKAEFQEIIQNKEVLMAMVDVDVDVMGLVDLADFIFSSDEEHSLQDETQNERNLTFLEFIDVVLEFRGTQQAKVKDIADLRKMIYVRVQTQMDDLRYLKKLVLGRSTTRSMTPSSSEEESDGEPSTPTSSPASPATGDSDVEPCTPPWDRPRIRERRLHTSDDSDG